MIWWYVVAFFGGVIVGVVMMGLVAGSRQSTVHIYHEPDGSMSILSDDPGIVVEHHHVEQGG